MQIYRLPKSAVMEKKGQAGRFTIIPHFVSFNDLSPLAITLYLYYAGYKTSRLYPDGLMAHILKTSISSVYRAKKELKEIDALYIHHLGGKNYIGFVASVNAKASEVFRYWKKSGEVPYE